MSAPKFGPGDTITNGGIYQTVVKVTRTSYELAGGQTARYMPINLVDRLWSLADEVEIVEE